MKTRLYPILLSGCYSLSLSLQAEENVIENVFVEGREINLLGEAISASQGVVGQEEIRLRPLSRSGDVLEWVPGMVATQHSGSGKATQYFLRGFNLDHGTDFSTSVNGMPVNKRTHGHGQGYTDLNFLIPELVDNLTYKKGAYYADVGDFSGAGSASVQTLRRLDQGFGQVTLGEYDYQRALLMAGLPSSREDTHTIMAVEHNRYAGPWTDIDEDLHKTNLFLSHSRSLAGGDFNLTLMAYDNRWNSADQIPARAVDRGLIDELGSLDTTVGGESSRHSVSVEWKKSGWEASAYFIQYDMNLWSNFTYFLDDEDQGDQFEQVDDRMTWGGQLSYQEAFELFGYAVKNRIGAQWQVDDIDEVGLYNTRQRERLGVVRSDRVQEASLGLFSDNQIQWTQYFRTVLGFRVDHYAFDVNDQGGVNRYGHDLSRNSGTADDTLASLKASAIYSLNDAWEAYVSAGQGFHSNDARGTTSRLDPNEGIAIDPVDPLVRSFGYEAGVRGFIGEKLNTSMSVWALALDSELLFVGDAGNTEASSPSQRQGVELAAYYQLTDTLNLDLEYAYTDAKFTDVDSEENKIPGAIKQVLQAGVSMVLPSGWSGSLRARHFGGRPLTEDGSVTSDSTTTLNLRTSYRKNQWVVTADILNLTDSNDHDVDYFYESRLASDPSGQSVEGVHYHVIEPRSVRLSVGYHF